MKSLTPEVRADLLKQVEEREAKKITPRHHHDILAWPGETVLSHIHDEDVSKKGFEFVVKKVAAGVDTVIDPKEAHLLPHGKVHFAAMAPYRACVWTGETPEEALGCMLNGYADLARRGSIDPSNPTAKGSPPIQHAIHTLTERLLWQVERRKEHLGMIEEYSPEGLRSEDHPNCSDNVRYYNQAQADVSRDNEIISAMATSIAALARVKDL
jgi:hypothetical protein